MKRSALLAAIALLLAAGATARPAAPVGARETVTTLEYEAHLPAGPVRYHFQVAARSDSDARAAALSALAALAPGAPVQDLHPVAPAGAVSAAYAFWPWLWDDAELPVQVWYNPAGAPAGVFDASVTDALGPWSRVSGSRFAFNLAGVTSAVPGIAERVTDGKNVIGWQFLGCDKGCVLGVTSKLPDTHEVDIVLNSNPEAHIGDGRAGTTDVTTTILHELGHVAGLEHSCAAFTGVCSDAEKEAVMFYRYHGTVRLLQADDAAGIAALYPAPRTQPPAPAPVGGQLVPAPRPAQSPNLNVAVSVRPGWNLIALPGGPLEDTMRTLACVDAAYANTPGGWLSWVRGAARALNTLDSVDPNQAYWIHATAACSSG